MASMAPERVFERLKAMSEASARGESPMPRGVDMAPQAVWARLRDMAELSELCRMLGTGRLEGAGDAGSSSAAE